MSTPNSAALFRSPAKLALLFLMVPFAALPFLAQAQILKPISWQTSFSAKEAKAGETIELVYQVTVDKDWYLYSSDFDPELGPQVTTFEYVPHPSYELVGDVVPVNPKTKYDEIWEGDVRYFEGKGEFRQKIKVLGSGLRVEANVTYQVCTDVSGRCIPFDDTFVFEGLNVAAPQEEKPGAERTGGEKTGAIVPPTGSNGENDQVGTGLVPQPTETQENSTPGPKLGEAPATGVVYVPEGESTLFGFMIYAFLFGLAAIFTPCVFPMIPLTVSFFTKKQGSRAKGIGQALFYGLSIIGIYSAVGAILTPIAGPEIANVISTHWLPNILFFLVFLIFALSFFGMFDIVLPSGLVNTVDSKADGNGLGAIFFMALTLVLVSFSCTGPLVGSILVASAGGEVLRPVLGMFAFALAFALPFVLFAVFPQWLNSMPKSGGWLNTVKVTLGFVELALAFKFLSMADLVYHWGLLDRDLNIAIWIAIALFMGLYYLGKIRLPHDSVLDKISVPRMLLALACFTFVAYLLPGMFGAPLKALSGILPPQSRHDFDLHAIVREQSAFVGAGNMAAEQEAGSAPFKQAKHADKFSLPHGLQGYFDYEEALQAARRTGKPLFIDFTGHGCANCRKMEDNVWANPRVLERLHNQYVVVALYVDDRTRLPEQEWVVSAYDGKSKQTIGQVNMDIQISRFNNNAQPFYVLLGHDGELLAQPKAYDLDPVKFAAFLDSGLDMFNKGRQAAAAKIQGVTAVQ